MSLANELNYKLNCSDYVLHEGDKPIGKILPNVAIAFDLESGTMHKHGAQEMVEKWRNAKVKSLVAAGFDDMANDLVVICGRFQLGDLNKCLNTSGYVLQLYRKIQNGTLKELSEFPEKESLPRIRDSSFHP